MQENKQKQEKEDLLSIEFEETVDNDKSIVISMILFAIFILMLIIPKIYIAKHIYYTSLDINRLNTRINSLKEENKVLKTKIEVLKFKNEISY